MLPKDNLWICRTSHRQANNKIDCDPLDNLLTYHTIHKQANKEDCDLLDNIWTYQTILKQANKEDCDLLDNIWTYHTIHKHANNKIDCDLKIFEFCGDTIQSTSKLVTRNYMILIT